MILIKGVRQTWSRRGRHFTPTVNMGRLTILLSSSVTFLSTPKKQKKKVSRPAQNTLQPTRMIIIKSTNYIIVLFINVPQSPFCFLYV